MIRFTTSPVQVCRDLPAWDAFNRLSMADELDVNPSGTAIRYAYDTGNRRVAKVTLDVSESSTINDLYLYGGWQVLEERRTPSLQTNPSTTLHRQFVYGNYIDEPLVMDTNEDSDGDCLGTLDSRLFYHQNTQFSVYALTDADGNIVEAYAYDPYGKHVVISDGDSDGKVEFDTSDSRTVMGASDFASPYTFTGRRFDSDTKLYYYRNRYYEAIFGRFVSRDPLGYIDGVNTYQYSHSDSVSLVDPYGNWAFSKIKRKSVEPTAEVCADHGVNTSDRLAWFLGFDKSEYKQWMTDAGDGIKQQYQPGEKVRVPNTIIASWNGELGGIGRWITRWNTSLEKYEERGMKIVRKMHPSGTEMLTSMAALWSDKHLHGWFHYGHGNYFDDRKHGMKEFLYYVEYYENAGLSHQKALQEAKKAYNRFMNKMGNDGKASFLGFGKHSRGVTVYDFQFVDRMKYKIPTLRIYACQSGRPGSAFPELTTGHDSYFDDDTYFPIIEWKPFEGFVQGPPDHM